MNKEEGTPAESGTGHGTIGPYRLIEILGEGGFGVVYLAEQEHPIRRRVALKLIKPGMDTKQVIARFEVERQTVASMDHPAIAQVFEAGATDTGRPYFAMEYVPGIPVTLFCDQQRLSIRDRLELFLKVCDAIQHAHQKGAIHRDIKPSNVLVAMRDGVPVPKVIDFGIVKATTETAAQTAMTQDGVIVGTLGYMSPEQAGATGAVDTRSDIYSLGVLLYELLCGATPFDGERLKNAALPDALHIVREEEPPSMAARLAQVGEIATVLAERRSTDVRRLLAALRGELQWITLRALEKDPDRRYPSAAELAADIRRHLANEPVLAAAPSTMVRLRKYARRHRAGVVASTLVLLALVAGGIAAAVAFRRAVDAERVALREAESSRQVTEFLVELFGASSSGRARGEVVTARTLLDEGRHRIETERDLDPIVRSRLLDAMGTSYMSLSVHDEGVRLAREALAAAEAAKPGREANLEVARRLWGLAQALSTAAQSESVLVLVDRAIAILEASEETDVELLADCFSRKAIWWSNRGEGARADSFVTKALEIAESAPEPDPSQLMRFHSTKAYLAHLRLDLPEAERHYLSTLQLAEQTDQSSWIATTHSRLGAIYLLLDDLDKATAHAEKALQLARQIYSPNHRNLADALGGYAAVLLYQDRYEEAIVIWKEALQIERVNGTPDGLVFALFNVGSSYRYAGRPDSGIAFCEEAKDVSIRTWGLRQVRSAEALAHLARCCADAKRNERADSTYRAAIDVFEELGDTSILAIEVHVDYANFSRTVGSLDRADSSYARAEAVMDTTDTEIRDRFGRCLIDHAYLRAMQGRHEEAEAMMRTGFSISCEDLPEDDEGLGWVYLTWAAVRACARDADGTGEKLASAARCGRSAADEAQYPELAAYRASLVPSFATTPK